MDNQNIKKHNINFNFKNKTNQRNYGIDLFRIISMVQVLIIHLLLYTFGIDIKPSIKKYKSIWCLEIFSTCSVDSFALISGVVGYKNYKFRNLIYLWFHIFFYSFFTAIICNILDNKKYTKMEIINSLFPILIIRHWYFNSYFIMYLFIPFLNEGIKNLNRKTFRNIIIFNIFFFQFIMCLEYLKKKNIIIN